MFNHWQSEDIAIGIGGREPGVGIYNIETGRTDKTISLRTGESVYAVDLSPAGDSLIIGTRAGFLYLYGKEEFLQKEGNPAPQRFIQGAAVLSLCFLDEHSVAASDTAGRCLIWELTRGSQPVHLPTRDAAICALFQTQEGRLAGISMAGELIVWDLMQNSIASTIDIPAPPALSALVKPVYRRAKDSWLWPGEGGVIVIWQPGQNKVDTISAHEGDVYAIAVYGDEFLTIGRRDGLIKRWKAGSNKPSRCFNAPKGIISAAIWGQRQDCRMLLINDIGKASIYRLAKSQFEFVESLAGRDYRIVFGPDMDSYIDRINKQRTEKAEDIRRQIREKIAKRQYAGLNILYRQLLELGFEHLSLLLTAQEAASKSDVIGELKAYKRLDNLLSQNNMPVPDSLLRYTELLEDTWNLKAACSIYQRLSQKHPDRNIYLKKINRLSGCIEIVDKGRYVIASDIPLATVAQSATLLGKAFSGRFFINNIDEPVPCNGQVSADDFIQRYERLRQKRTDIDLPLAEEKEFYWLSKDKVEEKPIIIFDDNNTDSCCDLKFGIRILNSPSQTVLIPFVLFDTGDAAAGVSVEEHNTAIIGKLERAGNRLLSNARLHMIHVNVNYVIRQLITKGLAEKRALMRSH
jgi:hypothetical protein